MLVRHLTPEEQISVLANLQTRLESAADSVEARWIKGRRGARYGNFILGVYGPERKSKGLGLEDEANNTSNRLLQFTTVSARTGRTGKTAAALVEIDGVVWLLHDGRVSQHGDRSTPSKQHQIDIDGKLYFKVSRVDDQEFVPNIIAYQQTRYSGFNQN